jgi:hypothetical protein
MKNSKYYRIVVICLSAMIFISGCYYDNGMEPPPYVQEQQMTFISSSGTPGNCVNSFVKNLNGTDYAFLSLGNLGMRVLNISNPSSPQVTADYSISGFTEELVVTNIQGRQITFIAAGQGGLVILDISNLSAPLIDSVFNFSGDYMTAVFADEDNKILYAGGSRGNVYILDISDPNNFRKISTYQAFGNINRIQVQRNIAYIVQDGGMDIVNVVNPGYPVRYSRGESGDYAYDVSISGNYIFVANNAGGVTIFDVSNPSNPFNIGYIDTYDIALSCSVSGNLIYIAEDEGGVEVYDIYDPYNPVYLSNYVTSGYAQTVGCFRGYVHVADYNGFVILSYP